jgi:hypothetical protein
MLYGQGEAGAVSSPAQREETDMAQSSIDAMIGWALIVTMALGTYFGVQFAVGFVIRSIQRSAEEEERIQDELDELQRLELLEIVRNERLTETMASPGDRATVPPGRDPF